MQLASDARNRFHRVIQTILELPRSVEMSPQSASCTYIFAQTTDSLARSPSDGTLIERRGLRRCFSKALEKVNQADE